MLIDIFLFCICSFFVFCFFFVPSVCDCVFVVFFVFFPVTARRREYSPIFDNILEWTSDYSISSISRAELQRTPNGKKPRLPLIQIVKDDENDQPDDVLNYLQAFTMEKIGDPQAKEEYLAQQN